MYRRVTRLFRHSLDTTYTAAGATLFSLGLTATTSLYRAATLFSRIVSSPRLPAWVEVCLYRVCSSHFHVDLSVFLISAGISSKERCYQTGSTYPKTLFGASGWT